MNARQLRAGVEVVFADSERLGIVQSDLEASYDDNELQNVNSQIKTDANRRLAISLPEPTTFQKGITINIQR